MNHRTGTTRESGYTTTDPEVAHRFEDISRAVGRGDLERATEEALEELEEDRLTPHDRVVLRKHVVDWCAGRGLDVEARRHATQAARDARSLLGPTHYLTLVARNSELYWMCMTGYDEVAAPRFAGLVADIERHVGRDHDLAWAVRNNSAMPLKREGDYSGAARVYRRLLDDLAPTRAATDIDVLTTRDNLAEVLAMDGRYESSTRMYEALLADLLTVMDPGDHRVLRVRGEIATNLFCAGDIERARQLWAVLADDCRRHLGETHPETVRQRLLQVALAVRDGDRHAVIHWCRLLLDHLPDSFDGDDARGLRDLLEEYAQDGDAA